MRIRTADNKGKIILANKKATYTTMSTTTEHQQNISFFQRRLHSLESDIQELIVMYLQAQSTKNGALAEQCEITLRSARQHQYETTQALKQYQLTAV